MAVSLTVWSFPCCADRIQARGLHLSCQISQENAQFLRAKEVLPICRFTSKVGFVTLLQWPFSDASAGHPLSRNASANTVFQIPRVSPSIPQRPLIERKASLVQAVKTRTAPDRSMNASMLHRPLLHKSQRDAFTKADKSPPLSPSSSSNSSSSASSEVDAPAYMSKSRAYLRRSRYSSSKTVQRPTSDAEDDQADSPPFLPFSDAKACLPAIPPDPSSTAQLNPRRPLPKPGVSKADTTASPATVCSSSSSMQSQVLSPNARLVQNPLSSLSPRQRRITREGSEGSPSMGSSFSDLDDTSVTQSALEEAYAHEINHGASRMSTISQALRSRYLS